PHTTTSDMASILAQDHRKNTPPNGGFSRAQKQPNGPDERRPPVFNVGRMNSVQQILAPSWSMRATSCPPRFAAVRCVMVLLVVSLTEQGGQDKAADAEAT